MRPAGQLAAAPLPQHGAELVLLAEADPVVAAVQPAVADRQQVADLAVGVVDHRVEHRHVAQRLVIRSCGTARPGPPPASASIHSWHMPGPNGPSRYTVGGTRSQPAARDTAYAATSRPASVPMREVPQRPLPRHRLVHAGRLGAAAPDRAVQGRVGRDDQPPLHLQLALARAARARPRGHPAGPGLRPGGLRPGRRRPRDGRRAPGGRRLVSHWRPGGRSGAGRCAPRCPAAGRTAGRAAGPGRRSAAHAGRRPARWPR